MREYAVVFERGPASWGAFVPDLPGCVAAGDTREEAEALIREAMGAYIGYLRAEGLPVPQPVCEVASIAIAA